MSLSAKEHSFFGTSRMSIISKIIKTMINLIKYLIMLPIWLILSVFGVLLLIGCWIEQSIINSFYYIVDFFRMDYRRFLKGE